MRTIIPLCILFSTDILPINRVRSWGARCVEEASLFGGDGCASDRKFLDVTLGLSDAARIFFRGKKLDRKFLVVRFGFRDAAGIVLRGEKSRWWYLDWWFLGLAFRFCDAVVFRRCGCRYTKFS
jgi:hypothetical protein